MVQKEKIYINSNTPVDVGKIVDMQQTAAPRQSWSKARPTLPTRLRVQTTLDCQLIHTKILHRILCKQKIPTKIRRSVLK